MPDLIAPGTVWLVGAGPGDPDLLTRKAEKLICAADIVFHDALVSEAVLDLVPIHVECVSVGKRSGRHSKTQQQIDAMIVSAAIEGKRVVRLKGGDPAIFARTAEEVQACASRGIEVRICPGITAASAAAASAGTSLTLRGFARKLTFVTAHARAGEPLDMDWATLADPHASLAVYMGKAAAHEVSAQLRSAGLPSDTPAIVIENASLPNERIVQTRLDLLSVALGGVLAEGPVMLLIGSAVGQSLSTARSESRTRVSVGVRPDRCQLTGSSR